VSAVEPAPGAGELRAHLRERLPSSMVPAAFIFLAALPHLPNGKVDRRSLPAPEAARAAPAAAPDPPRSPAEALLAGLWTELLGVEGVGVHANFFELGGHSLLAVRMLARLQEETGIALTLRSLFEAPTIAELAVELDRGRL